MILTDFNDKELQEYRINIIFFYMNVEKEGVVLHG